LPFPRWEQPSSLSSGRRCSCLAFCLECALACPIFPPAIHLRTDLSLQLQCLSLLASFLRHPFLEHALAFPRFWNALVSVVGEDDSYDAQNARMKNSATSTRPNSTLSTKEINEVTQKVSEPANSPKYPLKACAPSPTQSCALWSLLRCG
jgi:hypothetical protein